MSPFSNGNRAIKELITIAPPAERAILVGTPTKGSRDRHFAGEHLSELARLVDTAGAVVVASLTQQVERPDSATYLGKGKVEELGRLVQERDATLIVFDDALSPAQGKNLEAALNKRVVDRAELILDIFATRARSAEAKMQVELAQLEYSLPRLTRLWTHLEKFRGGIGVRGPGETQLETDRRLVGHRIRVLKERLADVALARDVRRQGRKGEFRAALVGYTNAGKSSVLRGLADDRDVFVEDRLFATLDPLTREVSLDDKHTALVTDTVGFIRKLPHHLVASFRATLEEASDADVLVHVIDASHPMWEEQRVVVDDVLHELGVADLPVIHAFNKVDRLPDEQAVALRERITNLLPDSVFVSAVTPGGLSPLREALLSHSLQNRKTFEVRVPVSDGKALAEAYQKGEVLERKLVDGEHVLLVRSNRHAKVKARGEGQLEG